MKLAINLFLSLAMLAFSLWLVWPNAETRPILEHAIDRLTLADFGPVLLGFYGLLLIVHFCRAWRWHYLLAPLGVDLGLPRLMAVSSVGFMAILVVPARLGELVRPALIRKKGHISASAALGTVAVERIIDGLVVSFIVFGCFFALRGPGAPGWMMSTAYIALGVFAVATIGLVFALRWPKWTVDTALKVSLVWFLFPKLAARIEVKLLDLISGFAVLRDPKNLAAFLAWSVAYWGINAISCWVLARGMGVDMSIVGAFAMMGLVAVGISLPNSPGLVGQFQWLTVLGISLEIHAAGVKGTEAYGEALAYAIVIHLLQVIWYVGAGLAAVATKYVSFAELWASRKLDPAAGASDAEDGDEDPQPAPLPRARVAAGAAGSRVGED